ncbi:hypothetical protein COU37_02005 [Candidatus Micrarchaeota archaeon CG10_big_fil_rev_8_21_14_0_10_45_29]|nr:MAG: hypothetical protein COU37_02005 [Candidatus Micrarchaeota archaeon CG10_big_fil_rev_8_21_14_0_10_45_29]
MEKISKISITTIKEAQEAIRQTGACEQSIPIMAPKLIFITLKISGIRCPVANILKQEALSLGADASVSAHAVNCSKPTTDAVLAGTLKQLRQLAVKLKMQGYGIPKPASDDYAALAQELSAMLSKYK